VKRVGSTNGNGHRPLVLGPSPIGNGHRSSGNGHRSSGNGHGPSGGGFGPFGNGHRLGSVDYTLAKRALLREFRVGLLSRFEICDAHPELLRAAKYVGAPASRMCPVCGRDRLKLLAYVYADDLRDNNGRVWELKEALALAAAHRGGHCYVVEVCTDCSWNHLSQAFTARSAV
jgi:Family of unknown function (DUF5318)